MSTRARSDSTRTSSRAWSAHRSTVSSEATCSACTHSRSTSSVAFCGFREPASDPHTTELRVELARGVPVATVELDGAPTRTCVDTGAKLSYLEEARTRGLEPVDVADDFYPAFGTFRTPIYEIPVRIGEASFTMRVGSLPSALSSMLGTLGIAAILGTGVFRRFPVVRFDYSAARITLRQGMAPEAP